MEVDESRGTLGEDAQEVDVAGDQAGVDVERGPELEEAANVDLAVADLRGHATLLREQGRHGSEVRP